MAITRGNRANAADVIVGAGRLYFAEETSPGVYAGERYLGDSPGFTISASPEQVEVWSSDTELAEKIVSVTTQITRTASITLNEASLANLALFIVGDVSDETQTSAAATTEVFASVEEGLHYQLGIDDDHPAGVQSITLNEISDGAATTYVEGTDYEVDEAQGRIYIIPGGSIGSGPITVDYDVAAGTRERAVSASVATKRGRIRYIANNTTGTQRNVLIPLADVRPDGELAMKSRSESVTIGLSLEILKPDDGEAVTFYGNQVDS